MFDRKTFFDHARADPFGGSLSVDQVQGLTRILDEAERRGIADPRHLAYRLATTFHETARAMAPVRECGSEAYLKGKPYWPWVGEGLVQVTWEANARKFGATKPGDCMSWPVALRALFDGMDEGVFTGRRLSTYFNASADDPVQARRIINGLDKAETIANYHRAFLLAINAALASPPVLIASQNPARPTPELDLIRGRIAEEAARQAMAPAPRVAPPPHMIPQAAPRTGLAGLWDRLRGRA